MNRVEAGTRSSQALAEVFAPAFLRKLDRLRIAPASSLSQRPGNTPMRGRSQPSGIELESHKPYAAGDDLRHVDWNAYGRLDELLIKRFRAEREAPVHVFVDTSASMAFPATDGKDSFAAALAAALAYIALRHHDPVRIVGLGTSLPKGHLMSPWFRHRQALPAVRELAAALRFRGETSLAAGIVEALRQQRIVGTAIVLSDFLAPADEYHRALGELVARGLSVAAVRILGPAERDPSRELRRAQVVDAESGRERLIHLTPNNLAAYQRALERHLQGLRDYGARSGIVVAVPDSAAGLDACLFGDLPAAGLLR